MKYFHKYKVHGKQSSIPSREITKEEAREWLDGHFNPEQLDEIFSKEKAFRLYTPYAFVWTQTDDGLVPMAGFYGVCE